MKELIEFFEKKAEYDRVFYFAKQQYRERGLCKNICPENYKIVGVDLKNCASYLLYFVEQYFEQRDKLIELHEKIKQLENTRKVLIEKDY